MINPKEILKCSWTDTFGSLAISSQEGYPISKNKNFTDPCRWVPADAPLSLCNLFGCMNVCIYLESTSVSLTAERRTVTSVLIERSREIVLPQPFSASPEGRTLRANQSLRNNILGDCACITQACATHTAIRVYIVE